MNSRIKTTLAIMLALTMTSTMAMANDIPNGEIVVPTGITLLITNDVVFYNGAKITLTGGTLHVSGGNLYNADISIQSNSGSNVLVTGNGSIRDAAGKAFSVPKGTTMNMNCGTIK